MSNLNRITVIGRVVQKPEVKFGADSGSSVAKILVEADRPAKADGSKEKDRIPVIAWGRSADYIAENLSEGSVVIVEGRIEIRTVEDSGQKKWLTEVKATSVEKMDIPANVRNSESVSSGQAQVGNNPFDDGLTEDDVPF